MGLKNIAKRKEKVYVYIYIHYSSQWQGTMMNQIETSTYYPKLTKLLLSKQKPEGDGSCDSTYRQKHRKKKKKKKKKKPKNLKKKKKNEF